MSSSVTNYPNGVSSFGVTLLGSIPNVFGSTGQGNVYWVNPSTGSDGNDGLSTDSAFATIEKAYALAVSGDTIALSTNTSHTLSASLDVTKSRINFIGVDFFGRFLQQGAKVQVTSGANAYVIKDTGVRNSFVNIKFIQSSTDATALTVFQGGGEGTLFQNCSFTFGVANNLDETTASEFVAGTDSATFINCTFGSDTLLTSAARTVFLIDIVNTTEFKSNQLHNCTFSISSSSSTATFVKLAATTDILFSNLFKECTFYASVDSAGGAALGIASFTGTGTNKGTIAYDRCSFFNVTDVATATSGGNAATQIVAAVPTAGTAGIGVAPTA
jgi:hypothetical protein